jgi:hypothetical protein
MMLVNNDNVCSSDETVKIKYQWNIDRFLAYVTTWSGYVRYMEKYPEKNILVELRHEYDKSIVIDESKRLVLYLS